jgi:hypothetical protein
VTAVGVITLTGRILALRSMNCTGVAMMHIMSVNMMIIISNTTASPR